MLPNESYVATFEKNPVGKKILEELSAMHYDITSFDVDPYKTAFNEGRREVIRSILLRLSQITDEDLEY